MNFIPALSIPGLTWQDSDVVCALADSDRHLGHLIRRNVGGDQWFAYDATRLDESSHTFRCLGAFPNLASAKCMLELAVWGTEGDAAVN